MTTMTDTYQVLYRAPDGREARDMNLSADDAEQLAQEHANASNTVCTIYRDEPYTGLRWCGFRYPKRPVFGQTPAPETSRGCMDGGGRVLR